MSTIKEQRQSFAALHADHLAGLVGAAPGSRKAGWTARCVWYDEQRALTAVVGAQEQHHVDIALAHGLALAGDRPLRLVLPQGWSQPTQQRRPWLTHGVELYEHDVPADAPAGHSGSASPLRDRSKADALRMAGGAERSPDKHLGPAGEYVRPLLEWAAQNPDLSSGHRRDVRAWARRGQRVLAITATKSTVKVKAGVDAKHEPAHTRVFQGPISRADLEDLQMRVLEGVQDADAQKYGLFEEHRLQELLRRQPALLGLEQPVLREVPAWRPSGGDKALGRGFIDLLGMDALGDPVVVETKLAADDMLVLQGLDYWIWSNRTENRDWIFSRLNTAPSAALRLLYAVGGKGGAAPVFSKYAKAQIKALDDTVRWQVALLHDWVQQPRVELLPPRQLEPQPA